MTGRTDGPSVRRANAARFKVLPWREKIDRATLSAQLSWSNKLTIWKLRAMPALMRSDTVAKVISLPSNRIFPESGCK